MRLAVLVSGSGTNLQAIIDAINNGYLEAEIVLVVSNRRAAYALERAAQAEIPALYFPLKPYTDQGLSRQRYDADLADAVSAYAPDLIVLAGWMHVLSIAFLDQFPGSVINLHPALPGTFPGTESIRRAYEAFQSGAIAASGCMIHTVIPEIDAGEVICQADVPFKPGDRLDDYEARMHAAEHRLIVEGIRLMAERIAPLELA